MARWDPSPSTALKRAQTPGPLHGLVPRSPIYFLSYCSGTCSGWNMLRLLTNGARERPWPGANAGDTQLSLMGRFRVALQARYGCFGPKNGPDTVNFGHAPPQARRCQIGSLGPGDTPHPAWGLNALADGRSDWWGKRANGWSLRHPNSSACPSPRVGNCSPFRFQRQFVRAPASTKAWAEGCPRRLFKPGTMTGIFGCAMLNHRRTARRPQPAPTLVDEVSALTLYPPAKCHSRQSAHL